MDFGKTLAFIPAKLPRKEFFMRWLLCVVVSFIISAFSGDAVLLVSLPLTIALIIYSIAGSIARLRDIGINVWLALLLFVPLVNIFFAFYIFFAPSKIQGDK